MNARKVIIVTDSVAQVPPELARQLGIRVVPSILMVEGQKYLDGVDLEPDSLYQRMRLDKNLRLSTSAPSTGQFFNVFLDCLDGGAESVIYLGLTSRMSGTFNSAMAGAMLAREEYGDRQIHLFDTCTATIAQGFLVIEAAKMAAEGMDVPQILANLEQERRRIGLAATLETLEYLARGGRIGRAAFMLGNMIQMLPIFTFSDAGDVVPLERVRGHHRAMLKMVNYVAGRVAGCRSFTLAVMHADALPRAVALRDLAIERMHPDEIFITYFTPVMVAHAGPGMIGLAYHWD
jgi:DegV family protein with EDD domain